MQKTKLKLEYLLFGIFAASFISFQLVQDVIRPNYIVESTYVNYFLSVAPNFFPAIGIPALFIAVFLSAKCNNLKRNFLIERIHITSMLVSLFGLVSWEFVQILAPYGYFDWNDITWTFAGTFVFYLIWRIIPNTLKTDVIRL